MINPDFAGEQRAAGRWIVGEPAVVSIGVKILFVIERDGLEEDDDPSAFVRNGESAKSPLSIFDVATIPGGVIAVRVKSIPAVVLVFR